jgi:glycosyltransferase involved in cell wall biosynthesis
MRIVMPVIHFDLLTGTSMHVYELARVLVARGHEVTVSAPDIGGELTDRARAQGVRVTDLDLATTERFDLIHTHHHDPGVEVMTRLPRVPVVATIHSLSPPDRPICSPRVRTFVCVRPEIRRGITCRDGVPAATTSVIFNGIDRRRFAPMPAPDDEAPVLFVGTIFRRRRAVLHDLVTRTEAEGRPLHVVGIGPDDWLCGAPDHVTWTRREVWDVEVHMRAASEVASVAMSRTAIEAWACGRPATIYEIEGTPAGAIRHVGHHPPPPAAVMDLFDIEHMTTELERIYEAAA